MLSDAEIRGLPPVVLGDPSYCRVCGGSFRMQRAHFRTVGMGGRKKQGPRYWLCGECHHNKLHAYPRSYRLDISASGDVIWTSPEGERVIDHMEEVCLRSPCAPD